MLCNPNCPYFPNMEVREGEWKYDEDGIKRRLEKVVFKCQYDGGKIDWNRECPRCKNG